MSRSMYIVKPEAMGRRNDICQLIEASGLKIISRSKHVLSEVLLAAIYPNLPIGIACATQAHLRNQKAEFVIVEGETAVETLVEITGTELDPGACAPATIRRLFGIAAPVSTVNGPYYKNAIHRPKTPKETKEHFALLALL